MMSGKSKAIDGSHIVAASSGRHLVQIKRCFIHVLMVFLGLVAVIPIYIMLVNATRSVPEINSGISLIPSTFIKRNWAVLNMEGGFRIFSGFANSAIVAVCSMVLSIYFSALTAYALHIYRFKGRTVVWAIILLIMMLPGSITFIGFYQFMVLLGLTGTFLPLILPGIAAAATVLFIRQYMSSVLNMELVDAARIDGAGEYKIFNIIILPIIVPALAAQAIFSFVGSWNNYLVPVVILGGNSKLYTLPILIINFASNHYQRTEYGALYLGLAVSLVPIIIVYSFMSKYIISGITMGGIKE